MKECLIGDDSVVRFFTKTSWWSLFQRWKLRWCLRQLPALWVKIEMRKCEVLLEKGTVVGMGHAILAIEPQSPRSGMKMSTATSSAILCIWQENAICFITREKVSHNTVSNRRPQEILGLTDRCNGKSSFRLGKQQSTKQTREEFAQQHLQTIPSQPCWMGEL